MDLRDNNDSHGGVGPYQVLLGDPLRDLDYSGPSVPLNASVVCDETPISKNTKSACFGINPAAASRKRRCEGSSSSPGHSDVVPKRAKTLTFKDDGDGDEELPERNRILPNSFQSARFALKPGRILNGDPVFYTDPIDLRLKTLKINSASDALTFFNRYELHLESMQFGSDCQGIAFGRRVPMVVDDSLRNVKTFELGFPSRKDQVCLLSKGYTGIFAYMYNSYYFDRAGGYYGYGVDMDGLPRTSWCRGVSDTNLHHEVSTVADTLELFEKLQPIVSRVLDRRCSQAGGATQLQLLALDRIFEVACLDKNLLTKEELSTYHQKDRESGEQHNKIDDCSGKSAPGCRQYDVQNLDHRFGNTGGEESELKQLEEDAPYAQEAAAASAATAEEHSNDTGIQCVDADTRRFFGAIAEALVILIKYRRRVCSERKKSINFDADVSSLLSKWRGLCELVLDLGVKMAVLDSAVDIQLFLMSSVLPNSNKMNALRVRKRGLRSYAWDLMPDFDAFYNAMFDNEVGGGNLYNRNRLTFICPPAFFVPVQSAALAWAMHMRRVFVARNASLGYDIRAHFDCYSRVQTLECDPDCGELSAGILLPMLHPSRVLLMKVPRSVASDEFVALLGAMAARNPEFSVKSLCISGMGYHFYMLWRHLVGLGEPEMHYCGLGQLKDKRVFAQVVKELNRSRSMIPASKVVSKYYPGGKCWSDGEFFINLPYCKSVVSFMRRARKMKKKQEQKKKSNRAPPFPSPTPPPPPPSFSLSAAPVLATAVPDSSRAVPSSTVCRFQFGGRSAPGPSSGNLRIDAFDSFAVPPPAYCIESFDTLLALNVDDFQTKAFGTGSCARSRDLVRACILKSYEGRDTSAKRSYYIDGLGVNRLLSIKGSAVYSNSHVKSCAATRISISVLPLPTTHLSPSSPPTSSSSSSSFCNAAIAVADAETDGLSKHLQWQSRSIADSLMRHQHVESALIKLQRLPPEPGACLRHFDFQTFLTLVSCHYRLSSVMVTSLPSKLERSTKKKNALEHSARYSLQPYADLTTFSGTSNFGLYSAREWSAYRKVVSPASPGSRRPDFRWTDEWTLTFSEDFTVCIAKREKII